MDGQAYCNGSYYRELVTGSVFLNADCTGAGQAGGSTLVFNITNAGKNIDFTINSSPYTGSGHMTKW
jgi:hypothetical protein